MKYTNDEAFEEILKRGIIVRQKHDKKMKQILSTTTCLLAIVSLGLFSYFVRGNVSGYSSAYGSSILPVEAGGYVLAFILAFALGVIVTLIIRKIKEKKTEEEA